MKLISRLRAKPVLECDIGSYRRFCTGRCEAGLKAEGGSCFYRTPRRFAKIRRLVKPECLPVIGPKKGEKSIISCCQAWTKGVYFICLISFCDRTPRTSKAAKPVILRIF